MGTLRGIMAIVMGGYFFHLSTYLRLFADDVITRLGQTTLITIGGLMIFVGLTICWHYYREHRIRHTTMPTTGLIFINKKTDTQNTFYSAVVQLTDKKWHLDLTGGYTAMKYCDGRPYEAVVWTDPDTNFPLALSIMGRRLETMPEMITS